MSVYSDLSEARIHNKFPPSSPKVDELGSPSFVRFTFGAKFAFVTGTLYRFGQNAGLLNFANFL
jgi:hypothetical protein